MKLALVSIKHNKPNISALLFITKQIITKTEVGVQFMYFLFKTDSYPSNEQHNSIHFGDPIHQQLFLVYSITRLLVRNSLHEETMNDLY